MTRTRTMTSSRTRTETSQGLGRAAYLLLDSARDLGAPWARESRRPIRSG